MADQFSPCLIAAMDHLWFHHIILVPEPPSLLVSKTLKPAAISSTLSLSSPLDEEISSTFEDEEKSSNSSPISMSLDDSNNEEDEEKAMDLKERPTRLRGSTRSQSSSPSTQKRHIHRRYSTSKMQKPGSCRSLVDLELDEVKGFMDLGFIFNKEHLCSRMISVIPGLQRVELFKNKGPPDVAKGHYEIEGDLDYEKGIMRPYLSEAWLITRPDSPLLNLKIPRVTAAADMKKHLRFWAKTVASTVRQAC